MSAPLKPGDLVRVDGCASVQFGGDCALTLRVVAVLRDRPTFDGWIWLAGYALDDDGLATAKRELFVQVAGLHPVRHVLAPAPCATAQPVHP
ncbi:hypothetical protein O7606_23995 [Micromonospora sp. WMMD882]|uniref:hypothetical protein n=1 Tax=Micromonospora sp. WMMD882 TaxID=3015151 RepID=UPI00248C9105|nr:hypothetical protein [Micromonospora sp. WMMD882]WBB79205.1 hypothetical protein O7606_23995 [Micromonospora sp. WMMD882]